MSASGVKTFVSSFLLVIVLLWYSPLLAVDITLETPGFLRSAATQQTPVWCWAAVIQSILSFAQIPISQNDVVTSVHGPNGLRMPSTANIYEFQRALVGWRKMHNGENYTIDFSMSFVGAPPDPVYYSVLQQNRVVILGIRRQHVVVAYKGTFRFDNAHVPPRLVSLTYFDPWDGQSKTVVPGTPEFTDISDSWVGWAVRSRDRWFGPPIRP